MDGMPDRCLLVVPTLSRGGAERVFVDLAAGMADHGVEAHLAYATGEGELVESVDERVSVHALGASRAAAAVPALRRLLASLRPDAAYSALFHGNLLLLAAGRTVRRRPPLVVSHHTMLSVVPALSDDRLVQWSPRLVRPAYALADAVVAVSEGVADDLVTIGRMRRSRLTVLPNPLDLDRIGRLAGEPSPHPWLDEPGTTLVAAGRLNRVKGFDLLVQALVEVPGARLVILGEGVERDRLEDLVARLGLGDRVALPGAVANPYAALARADLVVSSSRSEALPTVLIEAVHLRRPVLATDCSAGVRAVLDEGRLGRIVAPHDAAALARGIESVLADPASATAGSGAADRYRREAVAAEYLALVEDDA